MRCLKCKLILLLLSICWFIPDTAHSRVHVFHSESDFTIINNHSYFFEDVSGKMSVEEVLRNAQFEKASVNTAYGLTNSALWFKISLQDTSTSLYSNFILGVANGTLDTVRILRLKDDGSYTELKDLASNYQSNYPFSSLRLLPGETATFLIRVRSSNPVFVPLFTSSFINNIANIFFNSVIFSVYIGIALIMLFYNLFIFFTTRDKNYLYYVGFIAFLLLAQICLQGYLKVIFGYHVENILYFSIPLSASLVGIFSTLFIQNFLELKRQKSHISYRILNIFIVFYCIAIVLTFFKESIVAQIVIQANTVIGILFALAIGIRAQLRGFRPAFYFNLSWSLFLVGVVIFVLKDASVLPFNRFTNSSILIGSSLEILLLSLALADKINKYKKEREESHALSLRLTQENARMIRDQNVILESKVAERTEELRNSNEELAHALLELQEAETQLVESEKMASLGQLTAGIAHEINNPINFVTSNVNPLRRDFDLILRLVDDFESIILSEESLDEKKKRTEALKEEADYEYLKTEIDFLIKGIGDGAKRTAEIVKGLRVFSRLDEDDLKKADINEGLDSTLVIVNHLLNNAIEVEKKYSGIPMIECFPGKLNQVFLNILSNAIHAVHLRWKHQPGGRLTITTWNDDDNVYVGIRDNGIGMDENTKKKMFEPFFTTKGVGEGTGLGMSIAYNTIRRHNGYIGITSTPNEGTEFIITLPIIHKLEEALK